MSNSFGIVSQRLVSSSSHATVAHSALCPSMDLLAICTHDSILHIQRLNWQKILQLSLLECDALKSHPPLKNWSDEVCVVSSLSWRNDGKAIVLGFHTGHVAILSMETRNITAVWRHNAASPASPAAGCSITTLKWVEMNSSIHTRLVQQKYMELFNHDSATSAALRFTPASYSTASSSRSEDSAAAFFSPLPSLDSILDSFLQLSTPVGAPVPTPVNNNQPARGGVRGGASAAAASASSTDSENLRSVVHDAFDSYRNLSVLLAADANGNIQLRACGTLSIFDISVTNQLSSSSSAAPLSVLSFDLCPTSGVLSVFTRNVLNHRIQLNTFYLNPLHTRSKELLLFSQHIQQLDALHEYISKCLEAMQTKWATARKSFANKMKGLNEIIDEIQEAEQQAAGEEKVGDSGTTDPASELLECLSTGIPSHAVQQFVNRFLSSGPWTKTMDLLNATFEELLALMTLGLTPAIERVIFRLEEITAMSKWVEQLPSEVFGLHANDYTNLTQLASSLFIHTSSITNNLQIVRRNYSVFGSWFEGMIRLINNEHDPLLVPSLGPNATQEEKDAQLIPSYASTLSKYGEETPEFIADFIMSELEQDTLGLSFGDIKAKFQPQQSRDAEVATQVSVNDVSIQPTMPLSLFKEYQSPSTAYLSSPSLTHSFQRYTLALATALAKIPQSLAKQCQSVTYGSEGTSVPMLYQSQPLSPAKLDSTNILVASNNILGTSSSVSIRSTSTDMTNNHSHMAAFYWNDTAAELQQQYVTVLKYLSLDADNKHNQTFSYSTSNKEFRSLSARHLTIRIPSAPSASFDTSSCSSLQSQVMCVEFYDANSFAVLVNYVWSSTEDPSVPSSASKLWLIDLSVVENDDYWKEIDSEFVNANPASSLVDSILNQYATGSILPVVLFSLEHQMDTTLAIPSRSRLFDSILSGHVVLNSIRSLAAVFPSGKGVNTRTQPLQEDAEEDEETSEEKEDEEARAKKQAQFLVQQPYKPTRRVILLDMDEEEEEDEDEEAEGAVEAEAVADDAGLNQSTVSTGGDKLLLSDSMVDDENGGSVFEESEDADAMDVSTQSKSGQNSERNSFGGSANNSFSASRRRSRLSSSFNTPMLTLVLSLLVCMMLSLSPVEASIGDWDPRFRYCRDVCVGRCDVLAEAVRTGFDKDGHPFPVSADPFTVLDASELNRWPEQQGTLSPSPLTWLERNIFGWDCKQNCGYECMHQNVLQRERNREPVVKYFGKWPFKRLIGTQEFFSSFFSILNALPHIYFFFHIRARFAHYRNKLSMLPLWSAYSVIYMNTWLWSTVFHARDFMWTERLDYFCASLGICFSLCIAVIRIWNIESWPRRVLFVFTPVLSLFLTHISYLHFIHFDYGWNMQVSIGVGIVHSILWVYNCITRWNDKVEVQIDDSGLEQPMLSPSQQLSMSSKSERRYHWKMLFVTLTLWLCASLEIFDFPPYFELLDAHSIWHGLTPGLGYMFYQWAIDDIQFQIQQYQKENHKHS